MRRCVIGIDFGTESGRAVLVDAGTGEELASHTTPYRHGVIDETLPGTGQPLPGDWALQHPEDYLEVLDDSLPAVLRQSGVTPDEVIGIGIDFTSCTVVPVDAHGTPLCLKAEYAANPHSWVKLWKHHGAHREAEAFQAVLAGDEAFETRYGGRVSVEWLPPKVLQVLREAPDIYDEVDRFVEAADWLVWQLTDTFVRNIGGAGYKALWDSQRGQSADVFARVDPALRQLADSKLRGPVVPLGTRAGGLTAQWAKRLGLHPGTSIAAGIIDAHAALPGAGVTTSGQLVMVMGTSTCHMLLGDTEKSVEGIFGVVPDGIIPGYFGYEAGQAAVGDLFAWFIEQGVPAHVTEQSRQEGQSVFAWLERRAAAYRPGQTGLVALDWWNGNRSVLGDAHLSGAIIGLTLQSKPEEIYLALLEATAFGARRIMESFEAAGVRVDELVACGGLPWHNRLLMQIYADVTGKHITVAASQSASALGAAMFAAVAAGSATGGYDSIQEAVRHMAGAPHEVYRPNPHNTRAYTKVYREYVELHDWFGRGHNDIMNRLRRWRNVLTESS